eukprot:SAG31_NODE_1066_length_10091_cov_5.779323_9_plen_160_part_00
MVVCVYLLSVVGAPRLLRLPPSVPLPFCWSDGLLVGAPVLRGWCQEYPIDVSYLTCSLRRPRGGARSARTCGLVFGSRTFPCQRPQSCPKLRPPSCNHGPACDGIRARRCGPRCGPATFWLRICARSFPHAPFVEPIASRSCSSGLMVANSSERVLHYR